jgi:hypothetical protein
VSCGRVAFVEDDAEPACPVCSSPLLEVEDPDDVDEEAPSGA